MKTENQTPVTTRTRLNDLIKQNELITGKPLPEIIQKFKELQTDFELSKKIATYDGYFQYYFEILKDFETAKFAFEHVNELHLKYFKKVRYFDWKSFEVAKNRWLKQ